jgi:hypothetical protein
MGLDLRKKASKPHAIVSHLCPPKGELSMTHYAKSFFGLAAIAFLCSCSLLLHGQNSMQNDQSSMGKNAMSTHQMITVTGCLKKGNEEGGYYIAGKDGTMWELSSKTVNLSEHVDHTVSVSGHEMPRSQAEEAKTMESEKSESGGNKYADLKVASLKMVSTSCTP